MPTTTDFASRVQDRQAGPCRLITLPMAVDDFVSFRGSFLTNPDFTAGHDVLQELAVAMLDQGTEARDRFEIAQVLENCGAKVNFSSEGLYVDVFGRCLTKDLPTVMDAVAEMLRRPRFDPEMFQTVQAKTVGELQRDMDETRQLASTALRQRLFPPAHPNYAESPEDQIEQLQSISVGDVRDYYDAHFGTEGLTFVVAGDHDHAATEAVVADAFEGWGSHGAPVTHATDADPDEPGTVAIPFPGKSNVDVRFGHALPIRRNDDAYLPLFVANFILGGNFSSRLMTIVRDEMGLTYSISCGIGGVSTHYSAYWQTGVALSHDVYQEGMEATMDVIRSFVDEGATEEELATVKTTITGNHTVGLATTKQVAQALLNFAERDMDLARLDRFPEDVDALTLDEVNDAIRTYLRPDDVHVCAAGTQPAGSSLRI